MLVRSQLVLLVCLCAACVPATRQDSATETAFDVIELSIEEAQQAMRTGLVSCRQLTRTYLRRIEVYDQPGGLNAIITLNPNAMRRAVFNEQADVFNQIPGVGKTTSEKILLHLKNKVKTVDVLEPITALDDVDTEVLAALTALGYSIVEAQAALQMIPKDAPNEVEERLRIALGYFSKPG